MFLCSIYVFKNLCCIFILMHELSLFQKLDKKARDQQEAIWELLSTEVAYINKLQVIKKVTQCLLGLSSLNKH